MSDEEKINSRKITRDSQTELHKMEQRFRDIAEVASDWFWETDSKLRFIYISNRFYEVSSIHPKEVIGKTRLEFISDEERKTYPKKWKDHEDDLLNLRSFHNLEYQVRTPDGKPCYIQISGKPYFNEDGLFLGFRGAGSDITTEKIAEKALKDAKKVLEDEVNLRTLKLRQEISERKQVEEALRESEAKYRQLFEKATDAIFIVEKSSGRYLDANAAAENLTGYAASDLIKMTNREVTPEGVQQRLNRIDSISDTIDFGHVTYIRQDGSKRIAQLYAVPINDDCVYGIAQDITEQKQAEEELRKSEEHLQSLFRAAPTGIGVVINRVFHQVNERICEMTGFSQEELVGQSARILYPCDEDYEYVGREKYKQISKHGTGTVETQWKHKNGRIVNVLLSSTPMDLDDLSKGVTFTALDITERKRAEEALHVSHERFLTVLESMDASVNVADMETYEILFMNKNMVESFGGDMVGRFCWEALRGESGPCQDCTNSQLIDEKGVPTGVCSWQGKNPITGKWYINHNRAIEWPDGHMARLQIATDITGLKMMEQQVQQSQKFEAIGTLAGGIAHDFNNLLMGIQGRTSLLSVDFKSGPGLEHIHSIEDYIRKATDLTNQLLGLARGGKYEVKPTDLNELLRNSVNMFSRTKREIQIHTKMVSGPLVVEVDQGQIDQVLLNLYVNAWQAMPKVGDLYLQTQIVDIDDSFIKSYNAKPGRYALASVTDTGVGMKQDIQQQIFDPFFTTKEKGRGTGLGLASAYGIIKNHNGIITVDSEVDHGTTFNIYLPLSDKTPCDEVSIEGDLVNGTENLLLVDDENMILDVGQAMLKKLGYHVLVADSGQKALDTIQIEGDDIDLVILDLIMPGMDGGAVFDCIKEIFPYMPVMLSSGYAINGQANKIMQKGCNGFIQKPFNISKLSKKVREILDEVKIG
ncbi:MAG: PAS domain S-box protein [Desulfobacterales bacterium]|nr:PAS domain S-box protein [Desulfobacterales bacterium]